MNEASWFSWALLSAIFAGLTAIFAKVGIQGVDSDLATLVRTAVIIVVLSVLAGASAQTVDDVRRLPVRIAAFIDGARETNSALKQFLHAHVYYDDTLRQERRRSVAVIGELFEFFLAHPDRLPEPYDELARENKPHRVVCDYIAGMTDGFCLRTHAEMLQS